MKNTKRLVAFLLIMVMTLSLCSSSVFAANRTNEKGGKSWGWTKSEDEKAKQNTAEEEAAPEEAGDLFSDEVIEDTVEGGFIVDEACYLNGTVFGSSEHYDVNVTADESAMLPEGTSVNVTEFAEDSAEYEAAKAALLAETGADESELGFVAFDISLLDGETPVEPAGPVFVSINLKELPAEAVEAADTLEIQHHDESTGEVIVETVATSEDIYVVGEEAIAEFDTNGFSTFTLSWKVGEDEETGEDVKESATIHWGESAVSTGGDYEEFDSATLDTSGGSISVANNYDGYVYSLAHYTYTDDQNVTTDVLIEPVIYKVTTEDGYKWQADMHIYNETTHTYNILRRDIADGSDIYVEYVKKNDGNTNPPSSSSTDPVEGPKTHKQVETDVDENNDPTGTYTIQLDTVGTVKHTEEVTGANVLIVLDRTRSMRYNMNNDQTAAQEADNRWTAALSAIDTLVTTLSTGENAGNDIEYALISFYRLTDGQETGNVTGQGDSQPDTPLYYILGTNNSPWIKDAAAFNSFVQNGTAINGKTLKGPIPSGSAGDNYNGTNWEDPLYRADELVNLSYTDSDKTYVIFVTDGSPNAQGTGEAGNGYTGWNGNGQQAQTNAVNAAIPWAKSIYSNSNATLYGVFCGTSTGYTVLDNMLTSAAAQAGLSDRPATINGTDKDTIESEFAKIAQTIIEDLGATNTSVDDGIPTLASVSASVAGEAGGYEYYKVYPLTPGTEGNYTYKTGATTVTVTAAEIAAGKDSQGNAIVKDGTDYSIEVVWNNAPGASYSEDNGVTWDLSSVGVLEDKVTYRIRFKVWPSQDAYDLLADLNNGVQKLDKQDTATLKQLLITFTDSNGSHEYTYTEVKNSEGVVVGSWNDSKEGEDGLTTAQLLALIDNATNVHYSILTNTHLLTTYTYDGKTYTDPPEEGLVTGSMILDDTYVKVKKIWNNIVDDRAAKAEYDDEGNVLYRYADLIVTKDKAVYMNNVRVRSDKDWISDNLYISCGLIVTEKSGSTITDFEILEKGHDYTIIEPDDYSYYWNLNADVYRPMVIDAKTTLLILEKDETVLAGLTKNYEKNSNGEFYKIEGKYYKVSTETQPLLTATNDRRSSLDLKKVVSGFAPEGTKFKFNVEFSYPSDVTDKDIWFSVRNGDETIYDVDTNATEEVGTLKDNNSKITDILFHEADDTYDYDYYTYKYDGTEYTVPAKEGETGQGTVVEDKDEEGQVIGTHKEYYYYTGYYYYNFTSATADDGSSYYTGAFYLNLEDGWNARFTNIPEGTEFEFEEVLDDGFTNESITAKYVEGKTTTETDCLDGDDAEMELDDEDPIISGTLGLSNGIYYIEYTNAAEFFFVYHSSNNKIERISMTDERVDATKKTFNITDEVNEGYLYGGYFCTNNNKPYSGAVMTDAQIFEATYSKDGTVSGGTYSADTFKNGYWTTDTGASPYTGSVATAWKAKSAQTVNGMSMTPAAGMVYYLKEVPEEYFNPALYYIYDDYAPDKNLVHLYLMVPVDDANYKYVCGRPIELSQMKKLYSTFTIEGEEAAGAGSFTAVQANSSLPRGYLTVWDADDKIAKDAEYTWTPYFVTKDGVTVTSIRTRTIKMGNACYGDGGFTATDAKGKSTVE